MNKIFTPFVLDQLKDQIANSLTDAFNIMFSFELSMAGGSSEMAPGETVKSFVELKDDKIIAILNVSIPVAIINQLTRSLGEQNSTQFSQLGQDLTCEITNIVGHAVRNYCVNTHGTALTVGLPQIGNATQLPSDFGVLTLRPLSASHEVVCLDFVYLKSA